MSERQWKRADAVAQLGAGKLTMREAAELLGLSVRQVRRIRRRIVQTGATGVLHGNRGRAPANAVPAAVRARMLRLRRTTYADFNDQHFAEKLATETPPLVVSVRTVRRVLRGAGFAAQRQRRAVKHRRRRERKAQAGLMLLWDGSRHDWLEGRGPQQCLMAAIDDATGELLPGAHFVTQECSAGYLRVLHDVIAGYGRPWSIYMDQHGALKRNDDHWTLAEERRGTQDPTQVGQALVALGIEAIFALSPQAKGRVERSFQTAQDRLVKGLRVAGVKTLVDANRYLEQEFLPWWNQHLVVAPANATNAHRPLDGEHNLAAILSSVETRQVGNDYTLRIHGNKHQIARASIRPGLRGATVRVEKRLDGSLAVAYQGRYLELQECSPAKPVAATPPRKPAQATIASQRTPWGKNYGRMKDIPIWQAAKAPG